ncbi:hypothetical protein HID58_067044, partial [Brassica napus]
CIKMLMTHYLMLSISLGYSSICLVVKMCEGDAQDLLEGVHEKLNVLALGDSWLDRLVKKKLIILISKDSVGLKRDQ